MSNHQNTCHKLMSMGVRKPVALAIVNQIDLWKKSCGAEWTVSRLKAMKLAYVKLISGETPDYSWIAYCEGLPKGPYRSLFRDARGLRNRRKVARCLFALAVYSQEYATSPTDTQLKKFFDGVQSKPVPGGNAVCHVPKLPRSRRGTVPPVRWNRLPRGRTRVPLGMSSSCAEYEFQKWITDNAKYVVFGSDLGMLPHVWEGIGPKGTMERLTTSRSPQDMMSPPPETVGRVGFIQESGYKLRSIANPNRIVQMGLEPLKSQIFQHLKGFKEDCTFDQGAGVKFVQSQLAENKLMHSIDLTSATDYFPLSYQVQVAKDVGVSTPHLELFQEVSRLPWGLPQTGRDALRKPLAFPGIQVGALGVTDPRLEKSMTQIQSPDTVTWTNGQPLGLGPSFALFALAHHNLVRSCGGNSTNYRILGDDIVIAEPGVAKRYVCALQEMSCPISTDKTLVSNRVAEFAGKVITRDCSYPSFKWRELSDRNFLDVAALLGPQMKSLLRPRQRRVLELVAPLPEFMGGLGWNPGGIPLAHRISAFQECYPEIVRQIPIHDTRFEGKELTAFLLEKGIEVPYSIAPDPHPNRMSRVLADVMMSCRIGRTSLSEDVVEKIGLQPFHRIGERPSGDPRGLTTLELWERRLGQAPGKSLTSERAFSRERELSKGR